MSPQKYAIYCPGYGHPSVLLGYSSLPPEEQSEMWCGECSGLMEWIEAVGEKEKNYQGSEEYRHAFHGPIYPTLKQTLYLIVLAQLITLIILTTLFLSFYSPS